MFCQLVRIGRPLYALRVPRIVSLPPASFRPNLAVTPLPCASGSLYQGPQETFTPKHMIMSPIQIE